MCECAYGWVSNVSVYDCVLKCVYMCGFCNL